MPSTLSRKPVKSSIVPLRSASRMIFAVATTPFRYAPTALNHARKRWYVVTFSGFASCKIAASRARRIVPGRRPVLLPSRSRPIHVLTPSSEMTSRTRLESPSATARFALSSQLFSSAVAFAPSFRMPDSSAGMIEPMAFFASCSVHCPETSPRRNEFSMTSCAAVIICGTD